MTLGVMNPSPDSEDLIQLEPLMHQVGGHSSMFVLDSATVCKPLIGREYKFYRTLPSEMKPFTPEFRGSLQVVLQQEGNSLSMAALPNEQMLSLRSTKGPFKNGANLRRVSSSSLDYDSSSDDDHRSGPNARLCRALSLTDRDPKNPWLQQCQQDSLNKLKQKSDSSNVVECIMLENLTHKYRRPCVLDLKMGTRQFGDDAPESKRRSQTAKAANTTTVSLGVRLAGMQVYNKEKKCYMCKNKYFGRQLSEESFKQNLRHFLHNGKRLQVDIMDGITEKLIDLRSIIAKLDSFRFFTSSLLILYDSSEPLKLHENESRDRTGSTRSVNEENFEPHRRRPKDGPACSGTSDYTDDDSHKKKVSNRKASAKGKIDIRLIDFAHATHKDMKDPIIYKGPDEGLILGLESLIKIFEEIRKYCDRT